MHCFSKSLIVICRYHHFTHRAANHCCQSLSLSHTDEGGGGGHKVSTLLKSIILSFQNGYFKKKSFHTIYTIWPDFNSDTMASNESETSLYDVTLY